MKVDTTKTGTPCAGLFHVQREPCYSGQMKNIDIKALVQEWVSYDPESGFCVWRRTDPRRVIGGRADAPHVRGYLIITLPGNHQILAHRAAWLLTHGEMPDGPLDHINRDRRDNRLANLRVVTTSQNNFNCGPRPNNTSGYRGVSWWKQLSKWRAAINVNGKQIYLGSFSTKEEAAEAYAEAAERHYSLDAPKVTPKQRRKVAGDMVSVAEIEVALGFNRQVVANRLRRGWTLARALQTPQNRARRGSET